MLNWLFWCLCKWLSPPPPPRRQWWPFFFFLGGGGGLVSSFRRKMKTFFFLGFYFIYTCIYIYIFFFFCWGGGGGRALSAQNVSAPYKNPSLTPTPGAPHWKNPSYATEAYPYLSSSLDINYFYMHAYANCYRMAGLWQSWTSTVGVGPHSLIQENPSPT